MRKVKRTANYTAWLAALKDKRTRIHIEERVNRLAFGNAGLHRHLGAGVSELKIDWGPGFRVYFTQRGPVLLVLLCGGYKKSQSSDITLAKALAAQLKENEDGP